jgi:hypothetical protein
MDVQSRMDEYAAATNGSTMEAPHDTTAREKDFDWADVDFESGSDDDGEEHNATGQHENHGMGGEIPSEEPSFTNASSQATSATEEKVANENETLPPDTFPKEARYQADVEHLQEQPSEPLPPEEETQQEQQERRTRKTMGLEMRGGSPSACISSTIVGKEAPSAVFVFQQESRPKAALDIPQEDDHQVAKSMQQARIEHEQSPSKEDKTTDKKGPVANESSDLSMEATALGLLFSPIS